MLPYFKTLYIALTVAVISPTVLFAETFPVQGGGGGSLGNGGGGYEPISGVSFGGSFQSILEGLFRYGIIITVILAIIMLVIGGIQYMGSESLFVKDDGRKRMTAALGGLLIALFSIFILNLILGTGGQGSFDTGF